MLTDTRGVRKEEKDAEPMFDRRGLSNAVTIAALKKGHAKMPRLRPCPEVSTGPLFAVESLYE